MTSWRGVLQGLQMYDEARAAREDRELREEQFRIDAENAREALNLRRQQMVIDLLPTLRESQTSSSALANLGARLQGYFGTDSPIVDRLLSSGDVEGIERVLSNVEDGYVAAQEEGRGDDFLETVRISLENEAEISPATVGELDTSLIEELLGQSLEEVGLPIETTYTIPGSVSVRPTIYQPSATLEDLTRVEQRIAATAVDEANDELLRLRRGTADITERLQDPSLDADTQAALQEDLIYLGDRMQTVENAIDDTTGNNPSYFNILGLYGNQAVQDVIATSTRRLDENSLRPTFRENLSRAPIMITSPDQAQRFFELGIITERDVILYNGQEYPVSDLIGE
jgi:hypothetical protein